MTFSIQYCCNFPYQYYYLLNTPLQLYSIYYLDNPLHTASSLHKAVT